MLFDPTILVREPVAVLSVLLIILIGKSIVAFAIVQLMGYPISTALTVSASLAQIGEFSFILGGLGIALGLMPVAGRDLILAGALLSVALNPLAFAATRPLHAWVRGHRRLMARFEGAQDLRLARLQATLDANRRSSEQASLEPDELVSKWSVFADLDLVKRAELLTLFKPRSAVPGDRLIRAGDAANEVFFISSGAVEVSVRGRRIRLGPGDFFGEMALLSGAPRSADVTAIDYCQLLTLDLRDFQHFVSKYPDLRARLDAVASEREAMNRQPDAAASSPIGGVDPRPNREPAR
jgi:CPA2 family monovalent cation:H+ antiporter-2